VSAKYGKLCSKRWGVILHEWPCALTSGSVELYRADLCTFAKHVNALKARDASFAALEERAVLHSNAFFNVMERRNSGDKKRLLGTPETKNMVAVVGRLVRMLAGVDGGVAEDLRTYVKEFALVLIHFARRNAVWMLCCKSFFAKYVMHYKPEGLGGRRPQGLRLTLAF